MNEWWKNVYHGGNTYSLTEYERKEIMEKYLFHKWWETSDNYNKRMINRIKYIERALNL